MEKIDLDLLITMGSGVDVIVETQEYLERVAQLGADVTLRLLMRKYIALQVSQLLAGESERIRGRIEGVLELLGVLVAADADNKHGLNQKTLDSEARSGPIGSISLLVEED